MRTVPSKGLLFQFQRITFISKMLRHFFTFSTYFVLFLGGAIRAAAELKPCPLFLRIIYRRQVILRPSHGFPPKKKKPTPPGVVSSSLLPLAEVPGLIRKNQIVHIVQHEALSVKHAYSSSLALMALV